MINKLTNEEADILKTYENDEWVSIYNSSNIEKYKEIAKSTFKKIKE